MVSNLRRTKDFTTVENDVLEEQAISQKQASHAKESTVICCHNVWRKSNPELFGISELVPILILI